jgi:hypothetical protein
VIRGNVVLNSVCVSAWDERGREDGPVVAVGVQCLEAGNQGLTVFLG